MLASCRVLEDTINIVVEEALAIRTTPTTPIG